MADIGHAEFDCPSAAAALRAARAEDPDKVLSRARDYETTTVEVLLRENGRCPEQTAYGHKGPLSVEFCGHPSKSGNWYGDCSSHELNLIEDIGPAAYWAAALRAGAR